MILDFEFQGEPVAKGRPKISMRGNFASAYTPKKTRVAESWIKLQAQQQLPKDFQPIKTPIVIMLYFTRKWPKAFYLKNQEKQTKKRNGKYPDVKPDLDNLIKTILDAMNGLVFEDDRQIISLYAEKRYGDNPYTIAKIVSMEEKNHGR